MRILRVSLVDVVFKPEKKLKIIELKMITLKVSSIDLILKYDLKVSSGNLVLKYQDKLRATCKKYQKWRQI